MSGLSADIDRQWPHITRGLLIQTHGYVRAKQGKIQPLRHKAPVSLFMTEYSKTAFHSSHLQEAQRKNPQTLKCLVLTVWCNLAHVNAARRPFMSTERSDYYPQQQSGVWQSFWKIKKPVQARKGPRSQQMHFHAVLQRAPTATFQLWQRHVCTGWRYDLLCLLQHQPIV